MGKALLIAVVCVGMLAASGCDTWKFKSGMKGEAKGETPRAASSWDTYEVAEGDTLWDIATASYGNGALWERIAEANGIEDPVRDLKVGDVLRIPRD